MLETVSQPLSAKGLDQSKLPRKVGQYLEPPRISYEQWCHLSPEARKKVNRVVKHVTRSVQRQTATKKPYRMPSGRTIPSTSFGSPAYHSPVGPYLAPNLRQAYRDDHRQLWRYWRLELCCELWFKDFDLMPWDDLLLIRRQFFDPESHDRYGCHSNPAIALADLFSCFVWLCRDAQETEVARLTLVLSAVSDHNIEDLKRYRKDQYKPDLILWCFTAIATKALELVESATKNDIHLSTEKGSLLEAITSTAKSLEDC